MYHGLSYTSRNHYNGLIDIPFWLLSAWEEAYFPKADATINASNCQEPVDSISIVEYIEYFANKDDTQRMTCFRDWMPFHESNKISQKQGL